jgi:hypothetical protein
LVTIRLEPAEKDGCYGLKISKPAETDFGVDLTVRTSAFDVYIVEWRGGDYGQETERETRK